MAQAMTSPSIWATRSAFKLTIFAEAMGHGFMVLRKTPAQGGGVRRFIREVVEASIGSISVAERLGDLVPIYHFPPRRKVVRSAVLVLEVVRMLPDIAAQNGGFAAAHSWH